MKHPWQQLGEKDVDNVIHCRAAGGAGLQRVFLSMVAFEANRNMPTWKKETIMSIFHAYHTFI